MDKKLDWAKIKSEYVSSDMSQADVIKKYGVSGTTVKKHCKEEHWVRDRKKYRERVTNRAIRKQADREGNRLAKIIETSRVLADRVATAARDPEQFNLWLCETSTPEGMRETEERVMRKVDMKSINEAIKIMQAAEKLERSINNILTLQEEQQLQIAREKWEAEKKQMATEHQKEDLVITFAQEDTEGWSI